MKKTYKIPQCKSVALTSMSLLAISWSSDDHGGIDPKPGSQDDYGVKGNNTDNNTPWYKHSSTFFYKHTKRSTFKD